MWCVVVWCGVMWCGVVWCGVVWYGVVCCGVVRCGEMGYSTILRHLLVLSFRWCSSWDEMKGRHLSPPHYALNYQHCPLVVSIWRQLALHWMYVQYCARTTRNKKQLIKSCVQCRSRDVVYYKVWTKSSQSNVIWRWSKILGKNLLVDDKWSFSDLQLNKKTKLKWMNVSCVCVCVCEVESVYVREREWEGSGLRCSS